ncbi:MAG: hypothetical protein ACR2O4_11470 [Hyphomicrobiaceae bacterium]
MICRDDVEFLIEEYMSRFGETPTCIAGGTFPARRDWMNIVKTIRKALDNGDPADARRALSKAA